MTTQAPTFLSAFSGIGGFDLGLERAGWECVGQVEIDPFCTKVLERHWPHVHRDRDIRHLTLAPPAGEQLAGRASPASVDLLCGGFPCQDLSVAGRRAGLAAPRSGLFFELVRLATELRPRWLLLENVPGLLSSNQGRDFAVVLAALGDAGYGVGWRVLDSRWFGVPQRRRRVFLVGRLGGPCPPAVLALTEGVLGHSEKGGEAGAGLAGTLGGGAGKRGWCSDVERMTFVPQVTAPATVATGLTRRYRKGPDSDATDTLVAFNHLQDPVSSPSVAPTLGEGGQAVALGLSENQRGEVRLTEQSYALNGPGGKPGQGYAAVAVTSGPKMWDDRGIHRGTVSRDVTPTLNAYEQPMVLPAVRRLTPTECERLQAFPDGWTCLCGVEPYSTWDCTCPDGPRYAALGNAVTVSVIRWIGERLMRAATTTEVSA